MSGVKMRSVVGKDGKTYRVPDNRGGKARRASGCGAGKAAGSTSSASYVVEEWQGKGHTKGGVVSRHRTLEAAKTAAKRRAGKRDDSWRIVIQKEEPRRASGVKKGAAKKPAKKGAGNAGGVDARLRVVEKQTRENTQAITHLTANQRAHEVAISKIAKAAEDRWSIKVPGFPRKGR